MTVRAKFRLNSYTTEMYDKWGDGKSVGKVEKRTLNFTPVYGTGSDENKAFWDATPTGSLQLGVVNPEAWQQFVLGECYYLDFTPAPDS